MQTGSSAQSILTDVLHSAATNPSPAQAISDVLTAVIRSFGASGASVVQLGDDPHYFFSGDVASWTQDGTVLADWATSHPSGVVFKSLPPAAFQPAVPTWYTVKSNPDTFMCVWFAQPDANADEQALQAYADILSLLAGRYAANDKQERANLLANSIVSSIADPLIVLDEDRTVILMNPAAEKIFSTTTKAAHGKPLPDVVQDEVLLEIINAPSNNAVRPLEWSTGEFNPSTFLPLLSVIQTPDGSPDGWVLSLRDVTRFKRLNRNQQEFLRVVSHDLRSPLTAMQGFADMLRMGMIGEVTEKQAYFLDKILAGIVQMTGIVDNIQDAGRFDPETGFYEMQRSQVDLGEIAQRIVQNHIIPAEKQELTVELRIADDVPIINADENMLTRAVTNLVDNAIKYTPNGGKVEVSIEREGDYVVVNVADDGHGISEEDQRRLFQRHVRLARKEHKKVKGTGLGLFIVRSVAQRHGGDARVRSELGEGTTFSIVIPLRGPNAIRGQ